MPANHPSKTTEDTLTDILAQFPHLAEKFKQQYPFPDDNVKSECAQRLSSLRENLRAWRRQWDEIHPRAAMACPRPGKAEVTSALLGDVLSTGIRFLDPINAYEILSYNCAMMYLAHGQFLLDGQSVNEQIRAAMRDDKAAAAATARCNDPTQSPLLSPDDESSVWEHTAEAVRALVDLAEQLGDASDIWLMVPPGFVAQLYCFLKRAGMRECFAALVNRNTWDYDDELGVYDLEMWLNVDRP
jgi:hypothetical protein